MIRSAVEMLTMGAVLMVVFVVIKYLLSMIPDGSPLAIVKNIGMAA